MEEVEIEFGVQVDLRNYKFCFDMSIFINFINDCSFRLKTSLNTCWKSEYRHWVKLKVKQSHL